jgi:DNA invertase Pin-like site-specific DNA recombinase
LPHLSGSIPELADWRIGIMSPTEQIDAITPVKLVLDLFETSAEFERNVIRERTNAGRVAAPARGRLGGRPKKLADPKQLALAQQLDDPGQTDIAAIGTTLGISRATLHRAIEHEQCDKAKRSSALPISRAALAWPPRPSEPAKSGADAKATPHIQIVDQEATGSS